MYVDKLLRNGYYLGVLLGFFVVSCVLQEKKWGCAFLTVCYCKCLRWSKSDRIRLFGLLDLFFFSSLVHTGLVLPLQLSSPSVTGFSAHKDWLLQLCLLAGILCHLQLAQTIAAVILSQAIIIFQLLSVLHIGLL